MSAHLQTLPLQRSWRGDTQLTTWLKSLAQCQLSVTVTFGTGRVGITQQPNERTVEEIVRKAIKRINTVCYGNSVKRQGFSIGAVTALEGKGQFERIHAHIGLDPPPTMPMHQFKAITADAFKPSKWIEKRPHMSPCWSQDWVNYMMKLGQDSLVPSCCFPAKHPSA